MTIYDGVLLIPIVDIPSSPNRWTDNIKCHIASVSENRSPVVLPLRVNVFNAWLPGHGRGKEHNRRGGGQAHDKGGGKLIWKMLCHLQGQRQVVMAWNA